MNSCFSRNNPWRQILLLLAAVLLAACSGGHKAMPPATPVITAQPTDISVVAGSAASFSVTATGDAPSYQWQVSTDHASSWAAISGATASTYSLSNTDLSDSGRLFRVLVTAAGTTVASSPAQLTVTTAVEAPTIIVQPVSQAVVAPATATFSVTASGTSLQYQWQLSMDGGGSWNDIDGATAASYTTPTVEAGSSGAQLRVRVSNSASSVNSNAVVLTIYVEGSVIGAPFFSEQPSDQSVILGSSATFFAGVSGVPEASLQWQRSDNAGANWSDIAGAISTSYSTPATVAGDNGAQFRLVASNSEGSATSNTVTLTVADSAAPVFVTQPQSATLAPGDTIILTAEAEGTPTPTYQWQVSEDNGQNWNNMNGVTSDSYEALAERDPNTLRKYRATASNSAGTANSNPAKVYLQCPVALLFTNPPVSIDGHPLMYVNDGNSNFCPPAYDTRSSVNPDTGIQTIQFKDVGITRGWSLEVQYRAATQAQAQWILLTYQHPYVDSSESAVFYCGDETCAGVSVDLDNHLITFNHAALGSVYWDGVLSFP